MERLRLRLTAGGEKTLEVSAVFVAMDFVPTGDLLKGLVEVDAHGYVMTSESTETGVPGLYIAGDVRRKSLRQIVTAVADGAVAAQRAGKYVRSREGQRSETPET